MVSRKGMAEESSSGKKLTIGVPRETAPNERRVALTPDGVKKYVAAGVTVLVQKDAGKDAFISDAIFENAGAKIVEETAGIYKYSDLVLKVQKPTFEEIDHMQPGSTLIAFLSPMVDLDLVKHLQERKITSLSMDAIPRTTRAQYMDALSSQATVGGYKAVLIAAYELPKFFPLLTTAAGNIPPAKVLVIGAGVAGLMAIGTARRLGAVVEAYDARSVVKSRSKASAASTSRSIPERTLPAPVDMPRKQPTKSCAASRRVSRSAPPNPTSSSPRPPFPDARRRV
jgi:NAD(P) transhydrogenase subunit alpha